MKRNSPFALGPLAAAAGVLALLFAGGNAPALANGCLRLAESDNVFFPPVPEASRKPQNLSVSQNASGTLFTVTWEVASDFPTDVLTGFCMKQTHPDSGDEEEEDCRDLPDARQVQANNCYPDPVGNFSMEHCYGGTHKFRVNLTTSCDQELPSDTVEIESTYSG